MDDADSGQDFTADVELTKRSTGDLIQLNATDASLANANDNILLEEDLRFKTESISDENIIYSLTSKFTEKN